LSPCSIVASDSDAVAVIVRSGPAMTSRTMPLPTT
jgi:hypothetical protein